MDETEIQNQLENNETEFLIKNSIIEEFLFKEKNLQKKELSEEREKYLNFLCINYKTVIPDFIRDKNLFE